MSPTIKTRSKPLNFKVQIVIFLEPVNDNHPNITTLTKVRIELLGLGWQVKW